MDFKTVVRQWLKDKGLLQGDLASRMGITPASLSDMLTRGNPTLTTLHKFQRAMDVSMVIFEENPKSPKGKNV